MLAAAVIVYLQVQAAGRMFNTQVVKDAYGRPVLLFRNEFSFNQVRVPVREHNRPTFLLCQSDASTG